MIICSYVSISKTGPSVKGPEEKNAPDPTASGESAAGIGGVFGRIYNPPLSVSKKSFRHAVRIFKLLKKFENTC